MFVVLGMKNHFWDDFFSFHLLLSSTNQFIYCVSYILTYENRMFRSKKVTMIRVTKNIWHSLGENFEVENQLWCSKDWVNKTVDYTSLALDIWQVGLAITNVSIITTIIAITVSILYCSIMNKDFNWKW